LSSLLVKQILVLKSRREVPHTVSRSSISAFNLKVGVGRDNKEDEEKDEMEKVWERGEEKEEEEEADEVMEG
jgi:hypothetical protein